MKMSKAQFVFIASALKDAAEIAVRTNLGDEQPSVEDLRHQILVLRVSLATTFANRLGQTNPLFDRAKFVKAVTSVKVPADVQKRLKHLREELRAERISYGELAELQGLAAQGMLEDDKELLEAAGVPEFSDGDE